MTHMYIEKKNKFMIYCRKKVNFKMPFGLAQFDIWHLVSVT